MKETDKDIKVVILCGGMGTRLREETEAKPKPMIEVGGRPMLWHILKLYSAQGFRDFVLCLGYKSEVIKRYFLNYEYMSNDFTISPGSGSLDTIKVHTNNNHEENGWRVTLADTGEKTLKGARIKKIEKYIDGDTFMLTYGDGVANIDLHELLSFHKHHGRIGTVTGVKPPSRFGEMLVREDSVLSFAEKPQVSISNGLINGGFFVFNREIFEYLTTDETCDFEPDALERLAKDDELKVFELKRDWACMDTLRDMKYLNKLWRENKAFWRCW